MDRLLHRYYRDTGIVIALGTAVAAYFFGAKAAGGFALGGVIAMYNVRGIAKTIRGIDPARPSVAGLMFGGVFRLLLVSAFIVLVAMARMVDLFGLLAGFFVATMFVAVEGLREAREAQNTESEEAKDEEANDGKTETLKPE